MLAAVTPSNVQQSYAGGRCCNVQLSALLKSSHAHAGSNQLETGLCDGGQPGDGSAVVWQLSAGQVHWADGHRGHHPHGLLFWLWPSEQGEHSALSCPSARSCTASCGQFLALLGFEAVQELCRHEVLQNSEVWCHVKAAGCMQCLRCMHQEDSVNADSADSLSITKASKSMCA